MVEFLIIWVKCMPFGILFIMLVFMALGTYRYNPRATDAGSYLQHTLIGIATTVVVGIITALLFAAIIFDMNTKAAIQKLDNIESIE